MVINRLFNGETPGEIESKIENSINSGDLLDKSQEFITEKLKKLNEDGVLEKYEIDFLNSQLRYHEELKLEKDNYISKKNKISERSRLQINDIFDTVQNNNLSREKIKYINSLVNNEHSKLERTFLNNSYRDYVERNIDIIWSLEYFYENETVKNFYDIFSLKYLNFLENKYPINEINGLYSDTKKGLFLEENELIKMLEETINENKILMDSFNSNIIVNLKGGEKNININNIKNQLEENKNQLESEQNEKYEIELYTKYVNNINDIENIQNIREILNINNNIENNEVGEIFIRYLLEKGKISKSELLGDLEKNPGFNYLNFLEKYGFTEKIENLLIDLIERKLIGKSYNINGENITITKDIIDNDREKILSYFNVFNKMVVKIESNGENVDNMQGSSAKGYFQFMNGNNGNGRSNGEFSSFETALRRYYLEYSGMRYISSDKLEENENVENWVIQTYNQEGFDPKELSAENQNILFLVDIFTNTRKVENNLGNKIGTDDLLGLVSFGNIWSMRKLYNDFHHTRPDQKTKEVLERVITNYSPEIQLLLSQNF